MSRIPWVLALVVSLFGGGAEAFAQEPVFADEPASPTSSTIEDNRAAIVELMGREDVRAAARIAGVELDDALAQVRALEGEDLRRAADQARRIQRDLDDKVTLSVSTIVILLLLLLVIVIAA